jgi:eukaryotic-like serine/threonine-protein kinase
MKDISEKYDNRGGLGSGNFGTVYQGFNKILDRVEAVKVVPDILSMGAKANIEARMQHKLKHSNVVDIYDAFIRNEKLYILMEYLDGGSIKSLMDKGRVPIRDSIRIALDGLQGLQFIHNNNAIHRDVKPSNILLDKNGKAKLSDFGLSAELDGDGKLKSGFGYSMHKAPEVYTMREYRRESDIFALGMTMYRMVNGDGFISKFDQDSMVKGIREGSFPPRNEYSPAVPKKLRDAINKALEIDPASRYPNAHSMRAELGKIDVPINWKQVIVSPRKQKWIGDDNEFKYEIEVTKSMFSPSCDIICRKGRQQLRQINKHSYKKLSDKDTAKHLRRLLTKEI